MSLSSAAVDVQALRDREEKKYFLGTDVSFREQFGGKRALTHRIVH